MTTYYTVYYIFKTENKWVMLFNSFFYSTTHMINPVIYFSLNKEMRSQLVQALTDLLAFICCAPPKARNEFGSLLKPSMERKSVFDGQFRRLSAFVITFFGIDPVVSDGEVQQPINNNSLNSCRERDSSTTPFSTTATTTTPTATTTTA